MDTVRAMTDVCVNHEESPPLYPPEVWEQIFRHLSDAQLLRARSVCRRWRDIITGSTLLMSRFAIWLSKASFAGERILGDGNAPVWLLPVAKLTIFDLRLQSVSTWWPAVGGRLTRLTLYCCLMGSSVLFAMLEQTPNLRVLKLTARVEGTAEANFRLPNLQELRLEFISPVGRGYVNMWRSLGQICPRLRVLRVQPRKRLEFDLLVQAVRVFQDTLEDFNFDSSSFNILPDLCEMDRLRLKQFSIQIEAPFDSECWNRFVRAQPQMEGLVIHADRLDVTSILCDAGRAAPKLQRLTLSTDWNFETDFLQFMPNLEFLDMEGRPPKSDYYPVTNMSSHGNPRLKELRLTKLESQGGFLEYVSQCPLIQTMILHEFVEDGPLSECRNALNHLKTLHTRYVPAEILEELISQSPALEDVELEGLDAFGFEDPKVLNGFQQMTRLRKLTLDYGRVGDACVDRIIRYATSLEVLKIGRNVLSEKAIGRLEATRNIQVVRT